MGNRTEVISLFSMILGFILFFAPTEYLLYSIFFISLGVILLIIKKMWGVAGWASDKIEDIK